MFRKTLIAAASLALSAASLAHAPAARAEVMENPNNYCVPVTGGAVAYCIFAPYCAMSAGRYAPATPTGHGLIAHESAHVVQQGVGVPSAGKKIWFEPPKLDYGPVPPEDMPQQEGVAMYLDTPGAQPPGTFDPALAGFGFGLIEPKPESGREPVVAFEGPYGLGRVMALAPTAEGLAELELVYEQNRAGQTREPFEPSLIISASADDGDAYLPGGVLTRAEAEARTALEVALIEVVSAAVSDGGEGEVLPRLDTAAMERAVLAFRDLVDPPAEPTREPTAEELYRASIGDTARQAAAQAAALFVRAGGSMPFEACVTAAMDPIWQAYLPLRPAPITFVGDANGESAMR